MFMILLKLDLNIFLGEYFCSKNEKFRHSESALKLDRKNIYILSMLVLNVVSWSNPKFRHLNISEYLFGW